MKSLIRLLQLPVLPGLFGAASPQRATQAAALRAQMNELPALQPDDDTAAPCCGWFDSSHELQAGLEVMEHTHPAAVAAALPLDTWLDWELASVRSRPAQASWAPAPHSQDVPHARHPRRLRFRRLPVRQLAAAGAAGG